MRPRTVLELALTPTPSAVPQVGFCNRAEAGVSTLERNLKK